MHGLDDSINMQNRFYIFQVTGYVLQGRMDEARQLLSKEASTNPTSVHMCKVLDELMKKMPVLSVCLQFSLK